MVPHPGRDAQNGTAPNDRPAERIRLLRLRCDDERR